MYPANGLSYVIHSISVSLLAIQTRISALVRTIMVSTRASGRLFDRGGSWTTALRDTSSFAHWNCDYKYKYFAAEVVFA